MLFQCYVSLSFFIFKEQYIEFIQEIDEIPRMRYLHVRRRSPHTPTSYYVGQYYRTLHNKRSMYRFDIVTYIFANTFVDTTFIS